MYVALLLTLCSTVYGHHHDFMATCLEEIPSTIMSASNSRNPCPNNAARISRLLDIRQHMRDQGINAYILTTEDAHMRLETPDSEKRLGAISGLSSIIGTAVITDTKAALWTDGRSFRKATKEVDCGWELHRKGSGGITVTEWIKREMANINNPMVGASPHHISSAYWRNLEMSLGKSSIAISRVEPDLVTKVWPSVTKDTTINAVPIFFAGRSWQDKVRDMHKAMGDKNVSVMVLSDLDEIAWLFNARSVDFGYYPFFYSFAVIDRKTSIPRLYLKNHQSVLSRTPSDPEVHVTLAQHLNTENYGSCSMASGMCVEVREYDILQVAKDIASLTSHDDVRKVWISPYVNFAIYAAIPSYKVYQDITPARAQKAIKNDREIAGMHDANLQDSVALVRFFAKLEDEVKLGIHWTVYEAGQHVNDLRKSLQYYREESYPLMTGSGPSAVDLFNTPTATISRNITTTEIFMQDSGGQYLNSGTTDCTRSWHYGIPTAEEKEAYTRVLMAFVNVAMLKWPEGKNGHELDTLAREPLWELGYDYPHETGHGVGAFGRIVEGPASINLNNASFDSEVPLEAGIFTDEEYIYKYPDQSRYPISERMFFTAEPGFYKPHKFGIRLENVMMVKTIQNSMLGNCKYLGFEQVTLVPFERVLIDQSLLSEDEINWINEYHRQVKSKVEPYLQAAGDSVATNWLNYHTMPIHRTH